MMARGTGLLATVLAGGIFGFFYAWICSTMWGLDAADPRIAIPAMQAMNASVRNVVFAPIFFGTPVVALLAAGLCWGAGARSAALLFGAAGVIYLGGCLALTASVNVVMNNELAAVAVPEGLEEAKAIWRAYSPRWQMFNMIRTGVAGVVLVLCVLGFARVSAAKSA